MNKTALQKAFALIRQELPPYLTEICQLAFKETISTEDEQQVLKRYNIHH